MQIGKKCFIHPLFSFIDGKNVIIRRKYWKTHFTSLVCVARCCIVYECDLIEIPFSNDDKENVEWLFVREQNILRMHNTSKSNKKSKQFVFANTLKGALISSITEGKSYEKGKRKTKTRVVKSCNFGSFKRQIEAQRIFIAFNLVSLSLCCRWHSVPIAHLTRFLFLRFSLPRQLTM